MALGGGVLDGLGHAVEADGVGIHEVGDGAGELEDGQRKASASNLQHLAEA